MRNPLQSLVPPSPGPHAGAHGRGRRAPAESGSPLGIVAFSFGLRAPADELNPANRALAGIVRQARDRTERSAVVVVQWEVARHLQADDLPVAAEVSARSDRYLDSVEVWHQARALLRKSDIRDVVPVAQPFLHLRYVAGLIRADGFRVVAPPRRPVPFDSSEANVQWWTRSRHHLSLYALGRYAPVLRRPLGHVVGSWPS